MSDKIITVPIPLSNKVERPNLLVKMFVGIIQTFFSDFQSYQHLIAVSCLKNCLKASLIFDFVSSRSTKWRPLGTGAPFRLNRIATRNVFLNVVSLFLTFFLISLLTFTILISFSSRSMCQSQITQVFHRKTDKAQCTILRHWQFIWATINSKYNAKIASPSSYFCPHLVFHRFWDSVSWWKWFPLEFTFSFFFSN